MAVGGAREMLQQGAFSGLGHRILRKYSELAEVVGDGRSEPLQGLDDLCVAYWLSQDGGKRHQMAAVRTTAQVSLIKQFLEARRQAIGVVVPEETPASNEGEFETVSATEDHSAGDRDLSDNLRVHIYQPAPKASALAGHTGYHSNGGHGNDAHRCRQRVDWYLHIRASEDGASLRLDRSLLDADGGCLFLAMVYFDSAARFLASTTPAMVDTSTPQCASDLGTVLAAIFDRQVRDAMLRDASTWSRRPGLRAQLRSLGVPHAGVPGATGRVSRSGQRRRRERQGCSSGTDTGGGGRDNSEEHSSGDCQRALQWFMARRTDPHCTDLMTFNHIVPSKFNTCSVLRLHGATLLSVHAAQCNITGSCAGKKLSHDFATTSHDPITRCCPPPKSCDETGPGDDVNGSRVLGRSHDDDVSRSNALGKSHDNDVTGSHEVGRSRDDDVIRSRAAPATTTPAITAAAATKATAAAAAAA
eukprot:scpid80777/ scgid12413/ 